MLIGLISSNVMADESNWKLVTTTDELTRKKSDPFLSYEEKIAGVKDGIISFEVACRSVGTNSKHISDTDKDRIISHTLTVYGSTRLKAASATVLQIVIGKFRQLNSDDSVSEVMYMGSNDYNNVYSNDLSSQDIKIDYSKLPKKTEFILTNGQKIFVENGKKYEIYVKSCFDDILLKRKSEEKTKREKEELEFMRSISVCIRRSVSFVSPTQNSEINPTALFHVVIKKDRTLSSVSLTKSSGNSDFDKNIEQAITSCSPVPATTTGYFPEYFDINYSMYTEQSPTAPSAPRTQPNKQSLVYPHGSYVGEVKNGKADGMGTYTAEQSGTIYTGQFSSDTFSGTGTMIWTNGSKYVGEWSNDAGIKGVMTYADDRTATGTVKNAVFEVDATSSSAIDPEIALEQAAKRLRERERLERLVSQPPTVLSQLDGDWYSNEWKYGYTLTSGVGIATSTNSTNFKVGDKIIFLKQTSDKTFEGRQVYTDGKFYKITVQQQSPDTLFFKGEKNVSWTMIRKPQTGTHSATNNPATTASPVSLAPSIQSKLPPCQGTATENWTVCFGTFTFAGGANYVGEYKDGKRNGRGAYTFASGEKYVGEFKDGEYHGQGTHTFLNGNKYVGEFKDDKRNGQGTYTFANGNKYVGGFRDGKRNGQGTLTFPDGDKYVGEYKDDKYHGQGTYTFANGNKYVGGFRDEKYHGQGTYTFANGANYVGEYQDGKRNGQGTLTFPDGDKYVGQWSNDSGIKGVMTFANGRTANGTVQNAVFEPDATRSDASNTVTDGSGKGITHKFTCEGMHTYQTLSQSNSNNYDSAVEAVSTQVFFGYIRKELTQHPILNEVNKKIKFKFSYDDRKPVNREDIDFNISGPDFLKYLDNNTENSQWEMLRWNPDYYFEYSFNRIRKNANSKEDLRANRPIPNAKQDLRTVNFNPKTKIITIVQLERWFGPPTGNRIEVDFLRLISNFTTAQCS